MTTRSNAWPSALNPGDAGIHHPCDRLHMRLTVRIARALVAALACSAIESEPDHACRTCLTMRRTFGATKGTDHWRHLRMDTLRAIFAGIANRRCVAIGLLCGPIVIGTLDAGASADPGRCSDLHSSNTVSWRPHPRFGDVWVPAGIPPGLAALSVRTLGLYGRMGLVLGVRRRRGQLGLGRLITMAVGHSSAVSVGSGCRAMNGRPPGSNWRYGDEYVGWAPLPPDELVGRL